MKFDCSTTTRGNFHVGSLIIPPSHQCLLIIDSAWRTYGLITRVQGWSLFMMQRAWSIRSAGKIILWWHLRSSLLFPRRGSFVRVLWLHLIGCFSGCVFDSFIEFLSFIVPPFPPQDSFIEILPLRRTQNLKRSWVIITSWARPSGNFLARSLFDRD
jgi:hypothetical protein